MGNTGVRESGLSVPESGGEERTPRQVLDRLDAEAVRCREENPVWLYNKPGRWSGARKWVYFGLLAGSAVPPILVMGWMVLGRQTFGVALFYTLALTVAQLIYPVWALIACDFLRGRRKLVEELSLTQLGLFDIVYGSTDVGVGLCRTMLVFLFLGDFVAYTNVHGGAIVLVGFLAFRVMLHGLVIRYVIGALFEFGTLDLLVLFRVWGRILLWLLGRGLVFLVLAYALISFDAGILMIIQGALYWWLCIRVGLEGPKQGRRQAVIQLAGHLGVETDLRDGRSAVSE